MSEYLSKKIRVLALLAIIAVVFIHAFNLQDRYLTPWTLMQEPLSVTGFTEYFLSNGIGRFAVPIFFGISGYLYFRSFRLDLRTYGEKLLKRLRTLALPYLLWSAIALGIVWALQQTEWGKPAVDYWDIFPPNAPAELFLRRWLMSPVPFQLWFIRDLMLYVIFAPLWYLLLRYLRFWPLIPLALLWFFHYNFIYFEAEGLLFFLIGSYLAIREVKIPERVPVWLPITLFVLWIGVLIVKTLGAFSPPPPQEQTMVVLYRMIALHSTATLLGVLAVWFGYDLFGDRLNDNRVLTVAAPFASFIYFAHEPLVNMLSNYALTQWNTAPLAVYLTYPLLAICLCLFIGGALRTFARPVFSLLTGGRGT